MVAQDAIHASPSVCALIPARGGSKGIPRKNLRELGGAPLLAHSIAAAREAESVSRTIVTTDDPEIGAVATAHGAEVIWRPTSISGDESSSESALVHALDVLRDDGGFVPDIVVFLQPTSPRRPPGAVQAAVDRLVATGSDSLFSACEVRGFVWRATATTVSPMSYDPIRRPRRQDLTEQVIMENGSIYVFRPWVLRETGSRLGGIISTYMMRAIDSFEVDDPDDLALLDSLSRIEPSSAT